jgi:hypothetical protein
MFKRKEYSSVKVEVPSSFKQWIFSLSSSHLSIYYTYISSPTPTGMSSRKLPSIPRTLVIPSIYLRFPPHIQPLRGFIASRRARRFIYIRPNLILKGTNKSDQIRLVKLVFPKDIDPVLRVLTPSVYHCIVTTDITT